MKKITENALLFRVNQLKEKMAMIEATSGRGSIPATQTTASHGRGAYVPPTSGGGAKPTAGTPYQDAALNPNGQNADTAIPSGQTANVPSVVPADNTGDQSNPIPQPQRPNGDATLNPNSTNQATAIPSGQAAAPPSQNGVTTPPSPDAAKNPNGTNQATAIPSGQAAAPPLGTKFPTTPAEIKAFQKAHGLKDDGLIGPNTLTALAKAGIQPPAGFKMAGAKQHPAPTPHHAHQGAAAKPAHQGAAPGTVGYVDPKTGAVSSGDAERDERIAQYGQVAQMTPAQQHMFNMGSAAQDAKAAGQTAPAKAPVGGQMQSTGDPVKDSELAKQGNAIVYKEDQDLARIVQLARW